MLWYCIRITAQQFASGYHFGLQSDFRVIYMAFHLPKDLALFCKDAFHGDARYVVATSPAYILSLQRFFAMYSASPCEKLTESDDVSLLVGRADASWDLLK